MSGTRRAVSNIKRRKLDSCGSFTPHGVTQHKSAKALVHAFVSSRVDGCNAMLAGSSKAITDHLQRVLNAAGRVVSGTHKFDRGLTHLLHSELHWLDVPQRIRFKH